MLVKEGFSEWACSPGAGGLGDVDAPIWFCGIEPGSARKVHEGADGDWRRLAQRMASGPASLAAYHWEDNLKHRFGRWQAKLMTAIAGREFTAHMTACADLPLLKLNLYPMSFPSDDDRHWHERDFAGVTGIPTKALYRAWCEAHRFPVLSRLVAERKPRLIVGSGMSYAERFISAFAGAGVQRWGRHEVPGTTIRFYDIELREAGTHVVVIPFYGRPGGLNSDDLVRRVGASIREVVGPVW